MLFATLDPTMRGVTLPSGQRIILSDTVGFISDLPTTLIAAFRATLEEVLEADLIVHVRDSSHPESSQQKLDVLAVLAELGVSVDAEERMIEVFNKMDLLEAGKTTAMKAKSISDTQLMFVSALSGDGIENLLNELDRSLSVCRNTLELEISLSDGATLSWLYRNGDVLNREDSNGFARVTVGLDARNVARFHRRQQIEEPALRQLRSNRALSKG
jgi:GTP-binding protein HflX